MFRTALLSLFLLFLFPGVTNAQVINEFVPDANPEWVEFYNETTASIDLSSYFFDDDTDFNSDSGNSGKIQLAGILPSLSTCYLDLTTYLNNGGDTPTLFNSNSLVDSYTYSSSTQDKSYARVPDGGSWQPDQIPAKSTVRCSDLAPSPSPSPTATPTSTPTPTPTPTKTPTPTPKPTVKAKATAKPTSEPEENNSESALGAREELNTPTPTPEPEEKSGNEFPILAGLLVLVGISFFGVALYPLLRQKLKDYNRISDDSSKIN